MALEAALPPNLVSAKHYPKVFAWHERFSSAIQAAKASGPEPTTLQGDAALNRIIRASYSENDSFVDEEDPLGLKEGSEVEVWPTDTGFKHRDRGRLIGESKGEDVLSIYSEANGEEIRVHFPRTNFRIERVKEIPPLS